jgi:hypothetical protein
VSDHLFTPDEVNALIPRLNVIVAELMDRHQRATELQRALADEQRRIQRSGGALVDQRDWKARAERLDGLVIEMRQGIEQITALGGVVKDVDIGLVDFEGLIPGDRRGRPVNLCWKYGETAVGFWHGFDEGYANRKPLP